MQLFLFCLLEYELVPCQWLFQNFPFGEVTQHHLHRQTELLLVKCKIHGFIHTLKTVDTISYESPRLFYRKLCDLLSFIVTSK